MSGSQMIFLGGNPQQAPVDPYFYSVTSLLHGDGTNGGQNNTFLDSSTNNFTITRNGNTTQGSFSPFSQTGWSNYFDGNGDFLSLASNAAFAPGTGDFTFEAWINPTSLSATYVPVFIVATTGGLWIGKNGSNFVVRAFGVADQLQVATLPPTNQWTHIAVTRSGTTLRMFYNGSLVGSTTNSYNFVQGNLYIGHDNSNDYYTGYISNLRLVKGTAVYTADFTPPTAPLTAITNTSLLTCQANRFLDASSNNFTITRNGDVSVQPFSPFNPTTAYSTSAVGGSGYFDGSGDYLSMTSGTSLGSGDFTIGCWVYLTAAPGAETPVGSSYNYYTSGQNGNFVFRIGTTNLWRSFDGQGNQASITGTYTWTLNTWMYMAWVRSGSTLTVYKDGVSLGSVTDSKTLSDSANGYAIGADRINGSIGTYLTGYLSGFRILVGTADSTVPTAPPTAIANTQLLCNFTNGAIFDNAAVADYETVGNAQISTSVKKYGTGSMAFDGSGDRLVGAPIQTRAPGTGDFCYEFWFYANTSSNACLFDTRAVNNNTTGFACLLNGSSQIALYTNSTILTCGLALSASIWYHIAVTRTAGVIKVFVNGTVVGTLANTSNFSDRTLQLGQYIDSTGSLNGYIDDFRSSNGIGRYAYNFTPPTAEFPNIGGTVTLTADPYFDYTTLLLPGNGTNGAQNNTFLDSSTNAFSITRNGNTTQGTFSPFSQTGWSNYFDGTGDYLTVASGASPSGTGTFTVEFWIYPLPIASGYRIILANGTGGGFAVLIQSAGTISYGRALVAIDGTTTGAVSFNQWNHVALVRSGTGSNQFVVYINGTSAGTFTNSTNYSVGTAYIGIDGNGIDFPVNAYLSNVRFTNTAVYTSNFTPSTTPLTAVSGTSLLTCQSNRFIDNSTNNFTITRNGDVSVQAFSPFNPTAAWSAATYGGSGYFDGSGDSLSLADNAAWNMGSGDFTAEAWIYPTSFANEAMIMGQWSGDLGGSGLNWALMLSSGSTGYLRLITSSNGSSVLFDLSTSTFALSLNAWQHIAAVRSGNTYTIYVNGVSRATTTNASALFDATNAFTIGSESNTPNQYFTGYISDARVVKGTAVYTAAFTPPTAPLTAISGTSLLANFTNAGITDATSKNDLETVGNAQISTTQSKFGGSSMYFDGSGDYLLGPWNPLTDLGAGDFTIEFWMYPTAVGQSSVTYLFNLSTSGAFGPILIGQAASGYGIVLYSSSTGSSWNLASGSSFGTATANAWNHVALTRYGADVRLFLNGVVGTTLNWGTTALLTGSTYRTNIGSATGVANTFYTGYIDDLRVTRGIARYTSNFTTPSTAFLTL